MADEREVFTIVEDDTTAAGVKLPARIEGQASAAKNGLIGFSFKDSSGNVILPALNAAGQLPVTVEASMICINDSGTILGVLNTATDVVTLALALTKTYRALELTASATFLTLWTVVRIDDVGGTPAETEIWRGLTGPGQFALPIKLHCAEFNTIGGTGTQNLVLRGTQRIGAATDLHGYLGINELI